MNRENLVNLRKFSRKMVRELTILELNKDDKKAIAQNWHALIEIQENQKITISQLAKNLVCHVSSISKIVDKLVNQGFVKEKSGKDKREKFLQITKKGEQEIKKIDEFSNHKILNAFRFLGRKDQEQIIDAIKKYALALEKARVKNGLAKVKILTLSTSRALRKKVKNMVENIQKNEFGLTDDNDCILKAEDEFCYNNSCNFWYAINDENEIIASVGLKKIDKQNSELKKFYVAKEYRGQKLSQALILKLLTAAKNHNFKNLYLGTIDVLKNAQNFYEKYGFKKVSRNKMPENFQFCQVDNLFYKAQIDLVSAKIKEFD